MTTDKILELLKKAFELEDIKTNAKKEGSFFRKKVANCFYIPEVAFIKTANEFPMLKNAYKAGLVSRNKSKGYFEISSSVLEVRSTDRKKLGAKQFFSIMGDDNHERTTLHDALFTIANVRNFCNSFLTDPRKIKYSIRHRDGNPDDVVNFISFNPSLLGDTEDDIKINVERLNREVKFERGGEYGTF